MTLQSMGTGTRAAGIELDIAARAPWFHNIHLPSGHRTAPDHPLGDFPQFKWEQIAPHVPVDLRGMTALDIGCNAGFYSLQLAARGAEVLAIDHDEHYLDQARWVAGMFEFEGTIRFERMGVYDLAEIAGTFDVVLFMGVLYHLRYPLLALDLVAEKANRLVVFQTLTMPGEDVEIPPDDLEIDERERMTAPGWPKMAFIEHRLAGDPTNWWAPNHAAIDAMTRSCGLRVIARPGHEIYLCIPEGLPAETRDHLQAAMQRASRARDRR